MHAKRDLPSTPSYKYTCRSARGDILSFMLNAMHDKYSRYPTHIFFASDRKKFLVHELAVMSVSFIILSSHVKYMKFLLDVFGNVGDITVRKVMGYR